MLPNPEKDWPRPLRTRAGDRAEIERRIGPFEILPGARAYGSPPDDWLRWADIFDLFHLAGLHSRFADQVRGRIDQTLEA